jgi:hypothetical protein
MYKSTEVEFFILQITQALVKLTHWAAWRPDAPYFIILLCLTSDDFTHQGESTGT